MEASRQASARAFTGAEAAELAADKAEKSSRVPGIPLALRTLERLRLGPDLIPRVSPPRESEPAWQLPASTAPPSLGQVDARPKRKRQGTIRYKEGREDGYIGSVGLSQPRM
jgi:hypothetical protein